MRNKMAMPIPTLALRGTDGIWVLQGNPDKIKQVFKGDSKSECRSMAFSENGKYFAWSDETGINIKKTGGGYKNVTFIQQTKISGLAFSPLGTYLISADISSSKKDVPSLCIWETTSGKLVKGFFHKKMSDWKPYWSPDEKLMVRLQNNDVEFYVNGDFETPKTRLHAAKISEYSFSKSEHVAIYLPGSKGQPSNIRIFKYPNFNGCPVANKSFFKADRTTMFWNKAGTALLAITSIETSDKSYYGETNLHYLSIKGEGCLVPRAKDGPVHCVEWHPNSTQFCVVYGYMPAKATLYNLKCDALFDFGTAPRNSAFYNPQGNILCLAGFGNLQGDLEFWDLQQKKVISSCKAMDTTHFSWCPDGAHFITATMAPRLNQGNGYKLWHYTGSILAQLELPSEKKLWECVWMPDMAGKFPEKPIVYKKVPSSVDTPEAKPVAAYRPPHARGQPASDFKLHEYEPPSNNKKIPGLNPADTAKKSNKKSKAQKQAQQANNPGGDKKTNADAGDSDKDRKLKSLKKKLNQITKLKEQQKGGKKLDDCQMQKITKYDEVMKAISELEV
ncbi:eukaryotic translation initiation factor 2A-like [Argonauta hians]